MSKERGWERGGGPSALTPDIFLIEVFFRVKSQTISSNLDVFAFFFYFTFLTFKQPPSSQVGHYSIFF